MKITNEVIEEIKRLSQEEGKTDTEIAAIIGCSRATINRTRQKYDIPIRDINCKQDKAFVCVWCKRKVFIKRNESAKLMCGECAEEYYKKEFESTQKE